MEGTTEQGMHKGEGGRWAGTEVGGYRGGEVQKWRGTEGARVQKAGGFRRRGEILEWRERRLNWRWRRVELKRWLLICNIRV